MAIATAPTVSTASIRPPSFAWTLGEALDGSGVVVIVPGFAQARKDPIDVLSRRRTATHDRSLRDRKYVSRQEFAPAGARAAAAKCQPLSWAGAAPQQQSPNAAAPTTATGQPLRWIDGTAYVRRRARWTARCARRVAAAKSGST